MGIELAIGSLIGAAIAKAGAAAAAAGTAIAASAAAHPVLFTLGAVSAVAGATTGIVGGVQAHQAGKSQAAQAELAMAGERAAAEAEGVERQKRLRRVLSMQNAIFGGSNVDMGSGTPGVLAADTMAEGQRMDRQADLMSGARLSMLDSQRQDALSAGRYGMMQGMLKAGTSLIDFGIGAAQMGSVPGTATRVVSDPFKSGAMSGGSIYTGGIA